MVYWHIYSVIMCMVIERLKLWCTQISSLLMNNFLSDISSQTGRHLKKKKKKKKKKRMLSNGDYRRSLYKNSIICFKFLNLNYNYNFFLKQGPGWVEKHIRHAFIWWITAGKLLSFQLWSWFNASQAKASCGQRSPPPVNYPPTILHSGSSGICRANPPTNLHQLLASLIAMVRSHISLFIINNYYDESKSNSLEFCCWLNYGIGC